MSFGDIIVMRYTPSIVRLLGRRKKGLLPETPKQAVQSLTVWRTASSANNRLAGEAAKLKQQAEELGFSAQILLQSSRERRARWRSRSPVRIWHPVLRAVLVSYRVRETVT